MNVNVKSTTLFSREHCITVCSFTTTINILDNILLWQVYVQVIFIGDQCSQVIIPETSSNIHA